MGAPLREIGRVMNDLSILDGEISVLHRVAELLVDALGIHQPAQRVPAEGTESQRLEKLFDQLEVVHVTPD